jgi:cell division protein FtsI (penicillin-binding protein 3)
MTLAFGAIAVRLTDIQAVSAGRYSAMGRSQRIRSVTLNGERGTIFDRNGQPLALSVDQTSFWANPHLVSDPRLEAQALAPVLGLTAADLQTKLSSDASFVYLARKVDDDTAAKVKALHLDGIFDIQEPRRVTWPPPWWGWSARTTPASPASSRSTTACCRAIRAR